MDEQLLLIEDASGEIGLFLTKIAPLTITRWLEDREEAIRGVLDKLVSPSHRDAQYKNQTDKLRSDLHAFVEKKTAIQKELGATPFEYLSLWTIPEFLPSTRNFQTQEVFLAFIFPRKIDPRARTCYCEPNAPRRRSTRQRVALFSSWMFRPHCWHRSRGFL